MSSAEYLKECVSFPEYLKPFIVDNEDLVKVNESIYGLQSHMMEQKHDAQAKARTLLIVTGFSGAGKDVAVNALIERDKRFGWVRTCTTRRRRPEENDGNDTYIRLSEEEFQEKLKDGDVIEWIKYSEQHSCSLQSIFERAFACFEIPILRVDPKGTRFYTEMWKKGERFFGDVNLVTVFVAPPSVDDLEVRLWSRPGSNPEEVNKRLALVPGDIPYLSDAEYIAINETDKLNKMVSNIQKLFVLN